MSARSHPRQLNKATLIQFIREGDPMQGLVWSRDVETEPMPIHFREDAGSETR
jgi:hypothetical protein